MVSEFKSFGVRNSWALEPLAFILGKVGKLANMHEKRVSLTNTPAFKAGLWGLCCLVFWLGCGKSPNKYIAPDIKKAWEEEDSSRLPDSIKVASYNMFVGFPVEDLILKDLSVEQVVYDEGNKLYSQFISSRHGARIQIMADEISKLDLDIVGLQEVTRLYYADSLVADYPNELVERLNEISPDSYAISYQKLNDISFIARDSVSGDTLHLRFAEGNAILYKTEFEKLDERQAIFESGFGSVQVLDSVQNVERGYLHLTLAKEAPKNRSLEVVTSHLEILPWVAQSQAEELIKDLEETLDSADLQLLIGDWNAEPGQAADTTTTANGFIDSYAFGNSPEGGYTCCVADDNMIAMGEAADNYSRRIDYVYAKNIIEALDADTHLDSHFPLSGDSLISPADHAMVWSLLKIQH